MHANHLKDAASRSKPHSLSRMAVPPFDTVPDADGVIPGVQIPSLRRNVGWTLMGNMAYAACQWLMLVAIARLGSPEQVGQFSLAFAVTAPIMIFTNLKLRAVQATDIRHQYGFAEYLGLRLLTVPVALAIIAITIVIAGYGYRTAMIVGLVGLAKAFESVSDILHGFFQQRERMDLVSMSLILKGGTSLAALTIALLTSGSIIIAILALAVTWLSVLVAYDIPRVARLMPREPDYANSPRSSRDWSLLRPRFPLGRLSRLARMTLPLGLAVSIVSLATNVPRYFIESMLGADALGLFAATASALTATGLVVNAVSQAATPRLAAYHAAADYAAFRALLAKMIWAGLAVGISGALGAALFGRPMLAFLFGSEYAEQADVLVWIMVAAALGYTYLFLGTALGAMRRFSVQLPINLAGLFVVTVACPPLINTFGLVGAVWAMLLGGLVEAVAYFAFIAPSLRRPNAVHMQQ